MRGSAAVAAGRHISRSAQGPENGVIGKCSEQYTAPTSGAPDLAGDSLFPVDRARPDGVDMRAHSFATPGEPALPTAKVAPGGLASFAYVGDNGYRTVVAVGKFGD
jgi:hypothetical protein